MTTGDALTGATRQEASADILHAILCYLFELLCYSILAVYFAVL